MRPSRSFGCRWCAGRSRATTCLSALRERNMNQTRINSVLLGITPIVLFIALWQSLISFGFAPTTLLPPPGAVFGKLAKDFFNGEFLHDIAATLIRLFAGFGIAVVVGVFIGLAAAVSPAVNAVVKPLVRVL